jgi:hypothetical protein
VAFRFIAGNDHPDHDTIANFRKRFLGHIQPLFVEVLKVARTMGMLKMGTVALDGTKVHANASRHSALSYGHAEKLERRPKQEVQQLLQLAERADAADVPYGMSIPEELERREARLAEIAEAKAKIKARVAAEEQAEYQGKLAARKEKERRTGKKPGGRPLAPPSGGVDAKEQINLTDEESRIMPVAGGGFDQCYNAQAVVAAGSMLVVAHEVTQAANGGRLKGKDKIGVRVGRVINKYKVAKHFEFTIEDRRFQLKVLEDQVAAQAALDGIYVIRTSVPKKRMSAADAVRNYKALSNVERAFRALKTVDLKVRPIHHRLETRVRAYIFLCMLAYYVEWHLIEAWRPLLFADEDQAAKAEREPVAPAERSEEALQKVLTHTFSDGTPAHSFRTLLEDLSTIVRNTCRIPGPLRRSGTFDLITTPTAKQRQALELLETISV